MEKSRSRNNHFYVRHVNKLIVN